MTLGLTIMCRERFASRMVSHEPEEIANDLYEYRRALLDLGDLALRKDVQKEFDALRDAIADRLAQSGLHDYANRFRPRKGPVALYGLTKGRPMAESSPEAE